MSFTRRVTLATKIGAPTKSGKVSELFLQILEGVDQSEVEKIRANLRKMFSSSNYFSLRKRFKTFELELFARMETELSESQSESSQTE